MDQAKNTASVARLTDNTGSALKIGVIGIGNAGSQVAMVAEKNHHNVLVMNTSVKDLADEVLGKEMKAIRIGDGRGSGKDRENSMDLLKSKGADGPREILDNPYFKSVVEPADIVFICFSTGGGTGSGIGPYMAKLIGKAYKSKLIIPYGILPKKSESVTAQANTIACVDDIVKNGTPYMLADLEYYATDPMEVAYEKIGQYIAETMNVIRGDYLRMSTAGMADERDMMTVLSAPGYLTVHFADGITDTDLQSKTLQGFLIDALKRSPMCPPQHDGLVQYNCVIAHCPAHLTDALKNGDFSELNGYIGEPKATFSNYAVDETIAEAEVVVIHSGMTVPMDRFAEPKAKVAANKAKYEKSSALSLASTRQATELHKDASASAIVMGSGKSSGADLSFLDSEEF